MEIAKEDINKGLKELFLKRFSPEGFKYKFMDNYVMIFDVDDAGFALTWDLLCAINEIRAVNFVCHQEKMGMGMICREGEIGHPHTEIHFKY